MLPIDIFRMGAVDEAKGLAVVRSMSRAGDHFLITDDEEPMACFISDAHFGSALEAAKGGRWRGMIFENVELEVDEQSQGYTDKDFPPVGSLVVDERGLHLKATIQDRYSFGDPVPLPIGAFDPSKRETNGTFFTKWRAIIRRGETVYEIATVDASIDR